jgi:ABC-2 type transport system permease protein
MRVRALTIRILKQFIHDKRTMALMIIAPIFVLTLMSLVFNGSTYNPKVGLVGVPEMLSSKLKASAAKIIEYNVTDAEKALTDNEIDAVISFKNNVPTIKLEGSDPTRSRSVLLLVQGIYSELNPSTSNAAFKPEISYLHGSEEMSSFDNFGPVLIGFFIFFFVFLIAGISFLRERTGGTLERLLATPLRRWEVVAGYILGFGIFAMLQATLIAWFAIKILGMMLVGSFGWLLLITLLTALTALSLGTFLSAFVDNEFQMIQFIPIIIVPQVFFSGLFNMDTMADWLRWIGNLMPLKYVADALRNIMIRGKGWNEIAGDVYVLIGLSIFFIIANVLALRKHRKI